MTETTGRPADLTFGESIQRLERVVSQIEEDDTVSLEQALALYEQALALADDCRQRLAAAKLRLTELAVDRESGDTSDTV